MGLSWLASVLLGELGELFVILRNAEHYCPGVRIHHLHGDRPRLFGALDRLGVSGPNPLPPHVSLPWLLGF
jgi:hypothetical protein